MPLQMSLSMMMLIATLFAGLLVVALPHLLWLLWYVIAAIAHLSRPAYAPFGWTALGLLVVTWGVIGYGYFFGRFRINIPQENYVHSEIPEAFDGYKIVQISDLHLSTYNDRPAALQRIVDSINAQQPDLICFTGDLVSIGIAEARPYVDILRQLRATDGVVSVFGNHDMMIYARLPEAQRLQEVARLEAFERDTLGWQVLRNEHLTITRNNQSINILGVDNSSCGGEGFRTIYGGDLPAAMAGAEGFSILLSHDPTHWRAEVVPKTAIPLTLSGHTHSGQARLFGWSIASLSFEEVAGWYHTEDQSLYVNSGVGCTLPARINCPSELTVITLHRASPR